MPDRQINAFVSRDEVETFQRDGVVHLKGIFEQSVLDSLRDGIRRNIDNPSPRFAQHTPGDAPAHYWEDFWVWSLFAEFEDFLRTSPAAPVAGVLLSAQHVNLVMDNWFYREAGSCGRPPWHHDVSYFDFDGPMCVLWLPLQETPAPEGISFVRGSHSWGQLFMRSFFDGRRTVEAPVTVNGVEYHRTPDIDADPDAFDLVSFDLAAGDCIFFDIGTLHGASSETVAAIDNARFTARFASEEARIRYRGDWAKGERAIFEAAGHKDGDAIDSDFFPRLWNR